MRFHCVEVSGPSRNGERLSPRLMALTLAFRLNLKMTGRPMSSIPREPIRPLGCGTQVEDVRVPLAENLPYELPEGVSEGAGPVLYDFLPTSLRTGVKCGQADLSNIAAVVGLGPERLSVLMARRPPEGGR